MGTGTAGFDSGDVQLTGTAGLNSPFDINVVVAGIPVGPAAEGDNGGLYGVGFELVYDPAVIRVTNATGGAGIVMQLCASPRVPLEVFDGVPDTDGTFRYDSVDLGGNEESGAGRVAVLQIECVAAGQTTLTLIDTSTGGGANMGISGDSGGVTYTDPTSGFTYVEYEATITCVPGATFGAARVASAVRGPAAPEGGDGLAPPAAVAPARDVVAAPLPAAAAAAAAGAPAPVAGEGPRALPSAGGPSGEQSAAGLLMALGAIGLIAGSAAVAWVAGRKPA